MKNLEAHIIESIEAADAALIELLDGQATDSNNRVMRKYMIRDLRYTIQQLQHMLSDARKLP